MAIYKLDILAKEKKENLPYWLDPSQKQDKNSPSKQAIRDKHRARWLAEQEAKREKAAIDAIIERADALGLRLRDNPTPEDIEEANRFLGITERGHFIQDPTTGLLQGSEPGEGHGEGDGGESERDPEAGKTTFVDEAAADAAAKYGLSAHEFEKVYSWTGGGYRQLRTDKTFGKTLEKLPKVSGRVYRGTRVTASMLKKLKTGAYYSIEKFSSSSTQRVAAAPFMGAASHSGEKSIAVLFEINDSGHKVPPEIAKLAGTEREHEVILMRGDRYKIEKIEEVEIDYAGEDVIPAHYRVTMSHVS